MNNEHIEPKETKDSMTNQETTTQKDTSTITAKKKPTKDNNKKYHVDSIEGHLLDNLIAEHTSKDKDKGVEEEEIEEIDHVEKQMIQRISCENRMACEGMKLLLKEVEEEERNNAVLEEHEQMLKWCNKELQRVDRDKVELERKSNREG